MNAVHLTGHIVRDIEVKQLGQQGHSVVQNAIGVRRNFKSKDGEYETDFINFVAWRNQAEVLGNYTQKGSLIGISGRLSTRNYENQQGQRVYVTEVVVDNVDLLQSKNSQNNGGYGQQQQANTNNQYHQNNSYNQGYGNNNGFSMQDGTPVDVNPDDLPFDYGPVR